MEKYLDTSLTPKETGKRSSGKDEPGGEDGADAEPFPARDEAGDWSEATREACRYGLGSVSIACGSPARMKSLEEAADFQRSIQKLIMKQDRATFRLCFTLEGLCGGFIQDNTSFPSGMNRASTWDPELEEQVGAAVPVGEGGRDYPDSRAGAGHLPGSTWDVRGKPTARIRPWRRRWERPTPQRNQESERCDGLKAEAVAKHFLGFHNSLGTTPGRRLTPPRLLEEVYGKPFQAAIAEVNLHGVMPCYCVPSIGTRTPRAEREYSRIFSGRRWG